MSENTHEAPLDAPICSPSSTPETDAEVDVAHNFALYYDCQSKDDNIPYPLVVPVELARKLERELGELAGYLCRIKLPLPVRFVADLATLFPGKNTRMKDVDGYLCIFRENDQSIRAGVDSEN